MRVGLILSLQHHICIDRQLCGVELGGCGCVEGEYRHFNITYVSTVNYVGSNWRCMGVWRVNTITSTSHMYQPSTIWGQTGGVWVCGGLILSLQHHICINYVGSNWRYMGVWRVNTVTLASHMHQPSTMWGRTGGVWVCGGLILSHMHQSSTMWGRTGVCGGLILSLEHHICVNRRLCGVELEVYGCVEG